MVFSPRNMYMTTEYLTMKHESVKRLVNFCSNFPNAVIHCGRLVDPETQIKGPTVKLLDQGITEGLVYIDPLGRVTLTDEGKRRAMTRLVFSVPDDKVDLVKRAVAEALRDDRS